ncbi:MAG: transcriptional regulator [Gammaproteobacteria bacterium]|nr:transcriptional regulator [Gammaproteobacteria bacterium]
MIQAALIDAYQAFSEVAYNYLHIQSYKDYQSALALIEDLLEEASDNENDPLNPLIDLISHSIEQYEAKDNEIMTFVSEAESMPSDLALLNTLKSHYSLTNSDFPEIGDKTMVSKVLNKKRVLQRHSIEDLAERFSLKPSMFLS